jgi:hypothetical protein
MSRLNSVFGATVASMRVVDYPDAAIDVRTTSNWLTIF